jgi:hypothetical protein
MPGVQFEGHHGADAALGLDQFEAAVNFVERRTTP